MKSQDPRRATEVKKLLKAVGIDPRLIRSRLHTYSMGSSLNVQILDRSIDRGVVEKALKHFESYDLDEATGEILCGGNDFVFVTYAH